jgi:ABC-type nitrate/sulfonate/bicarbonate transport system permease component
MNDRHLLARLVWVLAPLALALAAWQGLALYVQGLRGVPFPGPVETLQYMARALAGEPLLGHSIYAHIVASLGRWLTGFCTGSGLAIVVALAVGGSRIVERLLMPLVYVLQLVPGLAWIPIAILLFGLGNQATIFMIIVTALAPVAVNMVAGIRSASEEHLRVARMAGAGKWDIFLHVLLPGAIPHLMSGLRVGLGNSWRVVVAAEMIVGTGTGLGYTIIQSRWTLDYTSAFVSIIFICLLGLVVEYLFFAQLERATVQRWGMLRGQS